MCLRVRASQITCGTCEDISGTEGEQGPITCVEPDRPLVLFTETRSQPRVNQSVACILESVQLVCLRARASQITCGTRTYHWPLREKWSHHVPPSCHFTETRSRPAGVNQSVKLSLISEAERRAATCRPEKRKQPLPGDGLVGGGEAK